MAVFMETTDTHAPRFLRAALCGGTLNNWGELNMTLIDSETGLMKIPLMCGRCKKSAEVLYRVSGYAVHSSLELCKNCADEYKKFREEFEKDTNRVIG